MRITLMESLRNIVSCDILTDNRYERAPPTRVGKKQKKKGGQDGQNRLPTITPNTKCKLRLLKLERVKDYLLMEEEFVANQERLRPQEEKNEEQNTKVRAFLDALFPGESLASEEALIGSRDLHVATDERINI